MKQRWLVAVIGLPLLLVVLLACPPWATLLLVCAIAGVAAYELLRVAGRNVSNAAYAATIFCAAAQVWMTFAGRLGFDRLARWPLGPSFLLTVFMFFLAVRSYGKKGGMPFSTVAAAIVGGAVFPMMYRCLVLLRVSEPFGKLYVLMPFAVAFAGDSLAMYCGKLFGKRKMTPVSPNKTWAGFWGNLLGSVLGMILLGFVGSRWLGYTANYPMLALLGACANLNGQLGDLSTSLVKRENSVKDYSRLFLTHGGVLDRFDSTLFIAPVIYFFVSEGFI